MDSTLTLHQNGVAPSVEPAPFKDNVTVGIKPAAPLHFEIDIDRLTVADLDFVERMAKDKASTSELVAFLGRVIPGVDINTVPLRAIPKLSEAVMTAIGGSTDPNG